MEIENYGDMVNREKEQAERIMNEFLTAAKELKKICESNDNCGPQCPLYDKKTKDGMMDPQEIDSYFVQPYQWIIRD